MYQGECPRCGREVAFVRMVTGAAWTVEREVIVGRQLRLVYDSIEAAREVLEHVAGNVPNAVLCATESGASARIVAGEGTLRGHPVHECTGVRGGRA